MKNKIEALSEKIVPFFGRLGSSIYLQAISGAMMGTLGIIMIGSIAVLLLVLPQSLPALGFLESWAPLLAKVNNLTIGSMALYVVVLIAYRLAKNIDESVDAISISVVVLLCFLLVTPFGTGENGNYIPTEWLGAQGVFSAMIVGIISSRLYMFLKARNITIKMPDGVPPMVTSVFSSLIPTILIGILFVAADAIMQSTPFGSLHQMIYSSIQAPLQGLGGNIGAVLVVSLIIQLLWFFGIHGNNVVLPIVQALWMTMDVQNLNALTAGTALPNITGYAFFNIVTWSGTSLGLVLLMLRAKSKQYREVGKVSLAPILFGIGEPVLFGTPLVMNFKLAVPLITNNAVCLLIAYILTRIGLVARCSGVAPIFGLPLGFYAAVGGSFSIILLQLFLQLIVGPLLWYPWFRHLDKETYEQEQKAEARE